MTIPHEITDRQVVTLPIDVVHPSPLNPRKTIDQEYISELAGSILEVGLIQYISVRPREEGDGYWIIAGECRYRACRLAGLQEIPCIVRDCGEREHLQIAIIENLHRNDVKPIEEARGIARLVDMGMTQQEIGEKINRKQAAISNTLRLLQLPEAVQEAIQDGRISASHGVNLARWKAYPRLVEHLAKIAIEDRLPSKHFEGDETSILRRYDNRIGAATLIDLTKYMDPKTHFDYTVVCKGCEHRRGVLCLNVRCWRDQESLWAEQEKARVAAMVREATSLDGAGKPLNVVPRGKLQQNKFKWLDKYKPAGCRAECAERSNTKDSGVLRPVCLNPECYQKLAAKESEKQREAKRDLVELRLHDAWVLMSDDGTLTQQRCLAIAAYKIWKHLETATIKRLVAEFALPPWLAMERDSRFTDEARSKVLDAFAQVPVMTLIRFLGRAEIVDELNGTIRSEYRTTTPYTDWFLGGKAEDVRFCGEEPEPLPADDVPEPLPADSEQCPVCGLIDCECIDRDIPDFCDEFGELSPSDRGE